MIKTNPLALLELPPPPPPPAASNGASDGRAALASSGSGLEARAVSTRVGLIVPSSNSVIEVDFYRRLPADATLHTARMYLEETTPEGESAMLDDHLPVAINDLRSARPDVMVFGCTSAGALRGNAYEAELIKRIADETGAQTFSVAASVRRVIREAGGRRVGRDHALRRQPQRQDPPEPRGRRPGGGGHPRAGDHRELRHRRGGARRGSPSSRPSASRTPTSTCCSPRARTSAPSTRARRSRRRSASRWSRATTPRWRACWIRSARPRRSEPW